MKQDRERHEQELCGLSSHDDSSIMVSPTGTDPPQVQNEEEKEQVDADSYRFGRKLSNKQGNTAAQELDANEREI